MKYQITSDNIDISENMKTLAEEKFSKIEKRLTDKEKDEGMVRIVLNKSTTDEEGFEVKIELAYASKRYFAEEQDFNLETALINTINEVERMRRKDDISYQADWKEQRKIKRTSPDDQVAYDENFLEDDEL